MKSDRIYLSRSLPIVRFSKSQELLYDSILSQKLKLFRNISYLNEISNFKQKRLNKQLEKKSNFDLLKSNIETLLTSQSCLFRAGSHHLLGLAKLRSERSN
jgi:hypothetical protein